MLPQADLKAALDAVHAGFASLQRLVDAELTERGLIELIRPHLGDLRRIARAIDDARAAWGVPSPGRTALPCLTGREQEVVRWLAAGKTDRDIGDILGISPRTVHKHLQRIYEKLGVETRTAAVVRAMGLGAKAFPVLQKNP
jgi:DNA-binding CsgD family transcriptional regulator